MKRGSVVLGVHATLAQALRHPVLILRFAIAVLTNLQLFLGYLLSGVNVILLTLALKGQDLSRVYPILALTFVWVVIVSLIVLPGEQLNVYRAAGIVLIVAGVSVLGLKK